MEIYYFKIEFFVIKQNKNWFIRLLGDYSLFNFVELYKMKF